MQYAQIKQNIAKLEEEADMLKPAALTFIKEVQGESEDPVALSELPGYVFSVNRGRRKWHYTQATAQLEQALKERQKDEQANGAADYEEGEPILVFKAMKD